MFVVWWFFAMPLFVCLGLRVLLPLPFSCFVPRLLLVRGFLHLLACSS
jgi:hypothetical protein